MLLICSLCVVIATSSHAPSVRAVSDALVGRASEYLRLDDVKKALNIGMLMMRDDVFLSHDGEDVVELMHKCIGSADRLTSIRTFLDRNRFEVDAALATMLISTSETSLILHSTRSDMDALRTFVQPLISVMAHYSHGILHRCMYEFLPSELRDESKYTEMFTPVSSETHPVVPGDRDYILARLPNEDLSDGLIGINFMGKVLRMSFPADKPERLVDLKTGCMVELNPSYHNLYLDPNSRSMFVEDVAGDIHVWYGGSKEVTIPRHVFEDKHAMNIHSSHFDFTADAERTFF